MLKLVLKQVAGGGALVQQYVYGAAPPLRLTNKLASQHPVHVSSVELSVNVMAGGCATVIVTIVSQPTASVRTTL